MLRHNPVLLQSTDTGKVICFTEQCVQEPVQISRIVGLEQRFRASKSRLQKRLKQAFFCTFGPDALKCPIVKGAQTFSYPSANCSRSSDFIENLVNGDICWTKLHTDGSVGAVFVMSIIFRHANFFQLKKLPSKIKWANSVFEIYNLHPVNGSLIKNK